MKVDIGYYEIFDMFLALRQIYSGERFKPFNQVMDMFTNKITPEQMEIIEIYGVLTNGYLSALQKLIRLKLTEHVSGEAYLLNIIENPESLFISDDEIINDEHIQKYIEEYRDSFYSSKEIPKSIGELLSTLWIDIFSQGKAQQSKVIFENIQSLRRSVQSTGTIEYLGSLSDRFFVENDQLNFRTKPEYKFKIKDIDNIIITPSIYSSRDLTFWYENNNLVFFIALGSVDKNIIEPSDMLLLITSAFNDRTRLKMLNFLSRKNCTAGELADYLQMNASTVSRHLKVFKDAGFIDLFSNDGKKIVYTINRPGIVKGIDNIKRFLENKE